MRYCPPKYRVTRSGAALKARIRIDTVSGSAGNPPESQIFRSGGLFPLAPDQTQTTRSYRPILHSVADSPPPCEGEPTGRTQLIRPATTGRYSIIYPLSCQHSYENHRTISNCFHSVYEHICSRRLRRNSQQTADSISIGEQRSSMLLLIRIERDDPTAIPRPRPATRPDKGVSPHRPTESRRPTHSLPGMLES